MKKLMLALIVFGILLPGFSFAQTVGQPETVEDVKNLAEKAWRLLKTICRALLKKSGRKTFGRSGRKCTTGS